MRIVFVGKHGQLNSNQDELAITRSLRELGHEVHLVQENKIRNSLDQRGDIVLFNHCRDFESLSAMAPPKVFWCFDRIYWEGPGLEGRNMTRMEWVRQATKISQIGFMTDGDWVQQYNQDTGGDKLIWLTQGFNQYLPSVAPSGEDNGTILFTGGGKHYGRASFVAEMRERYGDKFIHISQGVHGQALAQAIANASIVVAPPTPVTDRYWSNRVYLTLGLGGFLLHPYTSGLFREYDPVRGDLGMYRDKEDLYGWISYYLDRPMSRKFVSTQGREHTLQHHTYKNRCQELIRVVKERLSL